MGNYLVDRWHEIGQTFGYTESHFKKKLLRRGGARTLTIAGEFLHQLPVSVEPETAEIY
jgi:hypothetical protein